MRRGVLMVEVGGVGGVSDYTEGLVTALAPQGRHVTLVTARDHRMRVGAEGARVGRRAAAEGAHGGGRAAAEGAHGGGRAAAEGAHGGGRAAAEGAHGGGRADTVEVLAIVPWLRGHSRAGALARRARLGPLVNALAFVALLPRLALLARRSALVHFQGEYFLPLAALFALAVRATGTPLVHTVHGTFDRGRPHLLSRRVLAACAAATIVHTDADRARLPAPARRRAHVIPHGEYGFVARRGGAPDPTTARSGLALPADGLVVALLGQLRPDKGIADLLTAAREVPAVHVLICGEERGGLAGCAALLADTALSGRVMVREGFLEDAELAAALAAADVVALPYSTAGASGVLLLAYGAGRPVLAYPVGGLVELVLDGETGWLCARPDAAALAAALKAVAAAGRAECARRGGAGERLARERYSWDAIATATGAVYDRISARTSAE